MKIVHERKVKRGRPATTLDTVISSTGKSPVRALIETIERVNTNTDEAKLNETSMSDSNGKRIKYRSGKRRKNR